MGHPRAARVRRARVRSGCRSSASACVSAARSGCDPARARGVVRALGPRLWAQPWPCRDVCSTVRGRCGPCDRRVEWKGRSRGRGDLRRGRPRRTRRVARALARLRQRRRPRDEGTGRAISGDRPEPEHDGGALRRCASARSLGGRCGRDAAAARSRSRRVLAAARLDRRVRLPGIDRRLDGGRARDRTRADAASRARCRGCRCAYCRLLASDATAAAGRDRSSHPEPRVRPADARLAKRRERTLPARERDRFP